MKKKISQNVAEIMEEGHRTTIWYGDLEIIEECAKRCNIKKSHPKLVIKSILDALEGSEKFEKRYIYADFNGAKRKYRCFKLK